MKNYIRFGNSIIGMRIISNVETRTVRSTFIFFPFTLDIGSFEFEDFTNYSLSIGFFSYDLQLNLGHFPARHYFQEVLDEFRKSTK